MWYAVAHWRAVEVPMLRVCGLVLIFATAAVSCDSTSTVTGTPAIAKGSLYGPCSITSPCAAGLKCMPSAAAPTVFICIAPCAPSPKCPGVIKVGECRPMQECEQGCCQVENIWGDGTKLTCDGAETAAVLSDGYCQPRP